MQNEEMKVLNVKATPINAVDPSLQQVMNEALSSFSNEVPGTEEEKKAKSLLNQFKDYIKTDSFKDDVNEASKKYGVPPKRIAEGFFSKVLGTVGDILGIAVNVICNGGHMIVNLLGTVAHGIVNLIQGIANGLASIVTLNKTCIA